MYKNMKRLPENETSTVSVVDVHQNVHLAVREAMELAEWKNFISKGSDVSIKPNLGWDMFLPGAVTSPWVVEAVIQTILNHVNKIYLVESDQILVDVEKGFRQTRINKICEKYGVQWINMSRNCFEVVKPAQAQLLKKVPVPEILLRTELITIPVLKTHNKTIISGSLKNQWGCLPKLRHNYHLVLTQVLADINLAVRPRFAVTDGTIGLEGNGPKSGRPRIADLIMASGDLVALDAIHAKIIGFNPIEIPHLQSCAKAGLGICDLDKIVVAGKDIGGLNLNFQPARHNIVSWLEIVLRKSFLRWFVFHTPVLNLCCWGALLWYYIWYYLGRGEKMRDQILSHPYYGL